LLGCHSNKAEGIEFIMGMTWTVMHRGKIDTASVIAGLQDPWQLRLVDGLPAFPNESVPEEFQEIRLALNGCMVTLIAGESGLKLVTWSSIDPMFKQAVDRLAEGLASAGDGSVAAPSE
jgi:hypothetical protein